MNTIELVIEQTDNTLADFSLEMGKSISLGRSTSKSQIKVNDELCSSLHCKISFIKETVFVEDLNSKNGVFINGIRIRKQRFYANDRIRIGQSYIYLHPSHNSNYITKMLTKVENQDIDPINKKRVNTDEVPFLKLERKKVSLTKTDIVSRQSAKELPGHLGNEEKLTEKQIDRLILYSNLIDYISTLLIFAVAIVISYFSFPELQKLYSTNNIQINFSTDTYIAIAVIFAIPMLFHKINKSISSGSIGERLSGYTKHFD